MMKNVLSRAGRGQARVLLRQMSGASGVPAGSKTGARFLMPTQKRLQFESVAASCLGGIRGAHEQRSKGDEEILGFLEEEIATEKKMQRATTIPTNFEGFTLTSDKSEILLTKKFGNEEIIISCNVNHSVDAEFNEDPNLKQAPPKDAPDEMRSKPNFDVEIKRGKQILCFNCSFVTNPAEAENQEDFGDIFAIDEVCVYEGEWEEKDYAVAGDILDGYLYDLFMNLLEERGITNDFADKFSELCTNYEHKLYVDLLVKMQNFLGSK